MHAQTETSTPTPSTRESRLDYPSSSGDIDQTLLRKTNEMSWAIIFSFYLLRAVEVRIGLTEMDGMHLTTSPAAFPNPPVKLVSHSAGANERTLFLVLHSR